jgi:hypothetical protein
MKRVSVPCGPASTRATMGSVSARASKYSWLDGVRDSSGGFQHTQNRCVTVKEVEPAVVDGD